MLPLSLALASLLCPACDPGSEEIGATVGETDPTGGDGDGDGSADGADSGDSGETGGTSTAECPEGELPLVSGTVVREMTDTTWNEPFEPTPEAHVVMSLGDFIIDGGTEVVAERDLPFEMLPFDYVICGDPSTAFTGEGMHVVSIDVFNHEGTDGRVGDLIDEYHDEIDGPTEGFEILVGGLEHCDAPNAGGYCTTEE